MAAMALSPAAYYCQNLMHEKARLLQTLTIGVKFGDHDISWVTDDGTANTSDVSTEEGNSGLLKGAEGLFWLANGLVDVCDSGLERCELDHGVRNLTGPERV